MSGIIRKFSVKEIDNSPTASGGEGWRNFWTVLSRSWKSVRLRRVSNNGDFAKISGEHESNKSVSEIAEYHNMSVPTTWGLILKDKDDEQKLRTLDAEVEGLSCKPRPYDVWRFSGPHDLFGYDYDGRIPGQVVL